MPSKQSLRETFAYNMRALMGRRGMSQSELATRLGIKSQAVNQWFQAGGTSPDQKRWPDIATALGADLSEMLRPATYLENGSSQLQQESEADKARKLRGVRLMAARDATWDSPEAAAQELGISYDDLIACEHGLKEPDGALYLRLQQFGIGRNWIVHGEMGGLTQVVAALVGVLHPEVVPGLSELLARRSGVVSGESGTS